MYALIVNQRGGACLYDLTSVPSDKNGQVRFLLSIHCRPNVQSPQPGDRATVYETVVGTKRVLYHGEISLVDVDYVDETCAIVMETG
jgi:hypothetical protein